MALIQISPSNFKILIQITAKSEEIYWYLPGEKLEKVDLNK